MKIYRIWAIVLRYLKSNYKNGNRFFLVLYWSFLNIIIWGSTSIWIQNLAYLPGLLAMILTGLTFWQIVFRVNIETAKTLFDEVVYKNLNNLFSSPLTLTEWILAVMVVGFIDMILVLLCSMTTIWLLYNLTLFKLGWIIFPSIVLLLSFGWTVGFFLCGIFLCFGRKAQDLLYSFGYLFVPFSAVYYPLDSLQPWIQKIAYLLPTTYIFESLRLGLTNQKFSYELLFRSSCLSLIYLSTSIIFLKLMFEFRKTNGFSQL